MQGPEDVFSYIEQSTNRVEKPLTNIFEEKYLEVAC